MNRLTFHVGMDWVTRFTWTQDGVPSPLIAANALFVVADRATNAAVLMADTVSGTMRIHDALGYIDLLAPGTLTAKLPPGRYRADLKVQFADGTLQASEPYDLVAQATMGTGSVGGGVRYA